METISSEIKHHKEVHSFYICIGIIAFTLIFLQPLAMLTVIFAQAMMQ